MRIFTHTESIMAWLAQQRAEGKSIGFVPTMGALHEGHLTLIRRSKDENDITVCSLFVNPSQFDDSEDLQKYPRNHDVDMGMLVKEGCDVTFLPTVLEVYPLGLDTKVDVELDGLDRQLEGEFRHGHFDGMMEVVHRLLQITQPHRLYVGQKDFQQHTIVKKMLTALDINIELIVCPIVREADGLALSSRNARLTPNFRAKAAQINKTLDELKKARQSGTIDELKSMAFNQLKQAGLRPEYVEICDVKTLKPAKSWNEDKQYVALVAAWAGDVRLIDNRVI